MDTFTSYTLKNTVLKNRIVMPPMCMYSSDDTGLANDFHYTHYATRAIGGVGLIIVEATGVVPNGRISDKDLGIWDDSHIEGLKKIADSVKKYGSKVAIQLNHGGRKYEGVTKELVAPSPIAFNEHSAVPKELSKDEIKEIVQKFKEAAIRADAAGYDAIEIHAAHGYLISEFLSPLSNVRTDEYGGSIKNRTRFLKEILQEVSKVWPKEKPILIRVSATDYLEDGMHVEDMVQIINEVKEYIDMVDVSTGGVVNAPIKLYAGYQVECAHEIKTKCNIPTIAVGLITDINLVDYIVSSGKSDLVGIARELLRNPYFVLNAAKSRNVDIEYPEPYKRAF